MQPVYGVALIVHSWVRWLLLGLGLLLLVRAVRSRYSGRGWSPRDQRLGVTFIGLLDLQFLLGLLLYVLLSPIVRAAFVDPRAAMKSSVLRFFFVEHITAMLIAVAVAHIGWARVRKAATDAARHKTMAISIACWLAAVVIGIPWPFRPYGRPLARVALPASSSEEPVLYAERCGACHGARGDGAGVAAGSMAPPPRDFRDAVWQRSVSDPRLREVIARGGRVAGLSPHMPPNPDLSDAQLTALIAFIRGRGPSREP